MLSVCLSVFVMLLAVGIGIGALIKSSPIIYNILKYLGALYLLWLAWKTAISHSVEQNSNKQGSPLTLLEAALFQWINPKSWMIGDFRDNIIYLTTISLYFNVVSCYYFHIN